MFDSSTINEAHKLAARLGVATSSLLAVAEVESGGKAFATINGKKEPLIRWEGHYFDQRLDGEDKASARALGLSSPKAGKIPNPNAQAARWTILDRAAQINKRAAYESVSWGLGQVMGAHWKFLGFRSVDDLVALARKSVVGQMELMARFIEKNNLVDELRRKDWAAFARAYNGPGYRKNEYDVKMKNADARWAKKLASGKVSPVPAPAADLTQKQVNSVMHMGSKGEYVKQLQENLNDLGYGPIDADGAFGQATEVAVKNFQKDNKLTDDGWAGPKTLEAIGKALEHKRAAPKLAAAEKVVNEAAAGDSNISKTEIVSGGLGVAGTVTAAKEIVDASRDSVSSITDMVVTLGPWFLLGVVIVGGAAWIFWDRRRKRIEATAVQKVL